MEQITYAMHITQSCLLCLVSSMPGKLPVCHAASWASPANDSMRVYNCFLGNPRNFDHLVGRFAHADSIVPQPGSPQSLNRHAHVGNNQVRYTDPGGQTRSCADGICHDAHDEHVSKERHKHQGNEDAKTGSTRHRSRRPGLRRSGASACPRRANVGGVCRKRATVSGHVRAVRGIVRVCAGFVAGGRGFEPRRADPEHVCHVPKQTATYSLNMHSQKSVSRSPIISSLHVMSSTLIAVHAQPTSGHPCSNGGHVSTVFEELSMVSEGAIYRFYGPSPSRVDTTRSMAWGSTHS